MNPTPIRLLRFPLSLSVLFILGMPITSILAQESSPSDDPMVEALKEIESADWDHRWTGYTIALAGSAVGLGMGAWGLYDQPLAKTGTPDPFVFAASLVLVGTATTQIVHGGMRVDERILGARDARTLLANESERNASGLFFLKNRAEAARSTRLWGGLLTTAQGLGTTILGARLWDKGRGGLKTTGIVFTVMGVLNTAIGAVHFPGKARSGRVLDRTLKTLGLEGSVGLQPTTMQVDHETWSPGLSATGQF